MKMYLLVVAGVFLTASFFNAPVYAGTKAFNTVRIAYFQHGEAIAAGRADAFLDRAKKNGYNYVLSAFYCCFAMDTTTAAGFKFNTAPTSSPLEKKDDFKRAFQRAAEKGMRLIPKIQMGSGHSGHWQYAREHWNPRITMTRYVMADGREFGCHSFSSEPDGIDKTFPDLLTVIKQAYEEAGIEGPLEYVHIGHDEPCYGSWLLTGGCKVGASDSSTGFYYCGGLMSWKVERVIEACAADRAFIESFPGSRTAAVQRLITREISRRIGQVQSVFGPGTKVMFYADLWDPQFYIQRYFLWTGEPVFPTRGIGDLPGLTGREKKRFKQSTVLMPWNYDACSGPALDSRKTTYNAKSTFSQFSKKGFKFAWIHTVTENQDNRAQEEAFATASALYTKNCLGYCAASWDEVYADPPQKSFTILERLYVRNRSRIPK